MKLSELWLREWIHLDATREELSTKLTMSGLEVDGLIPVAEQFTQVVVGEVKQVEKHPEADRLKVCQVNVGEDELLTIVCGATNVRAGLRVAVALVGATLPNQITISRSKIRNVVSHGMLCSARELGMVEDSNGILELAKDAPLGQDLWQYLTLSDYIFDIAITPNRGDCLSIKGIAQEVAAITPCQFIPLDLKNVEPTINDTLPISIHVPEDCPRYTGRIIRQVNTDAVTPVWMQERLRRSDVRCISPVVDVMNYVMLELGQPMHAFDLQTLHGGICVRTANANEELILLDGQTHILQPDTTVIADDKKPLAIAGVMGGMDSGVSLLAKDIFLESAFFNPSSVARSCRNYHLSSDSSYRFERGIDPTLQLAAIERATQLILEIAGGQPGPVIDMIQDAFLPQWATIRLRRAKLDKMLGMHIASGEVEHILERLSFQFKQNQEGWDVSVLPRRSDISLEVDLIEEVIRIYGYEKLPIKRIHSSLQMHAIPESRLQLSSVKRAFCDLGYHEAITYTFVDKKLQQLLDPDHTPKELVNPITADMTVMRTNLWPGLITAYLYNQNRQQSRIRLFEIGLRFVPKKGHYAQQRVISGLISGPIVPEQWGIAGRFVDFFDLKGDIEAVLKLTRAESQFQFISSSHAALHPGQTAEILRNGCSVGILGALHPRLMQDLSLQEKIFVFEIQLDELELASIPHFNDFSKFPEIRRDIAIFVDQTVPSQAIQDTIVSVGGDLLRHVNIFDVYQGKEIPMQRKSIALALTLQHHSRTLVDDEVNKVIDGIVVALKQEFAAELRG